VKAGYTGLAIIGALTSVVSLFFYLRVVVMMYMTDGEVRQVPTMPKIAGAALVASAILELYLGLLPTRVLDWAAGSIATIF
jgi:NADH-quinone oxidoreductase subunit N